MPLDPLSVPLYPDVPDAPGVPPVLRQAGVIQADVILLAADAEQLISAFLPPIWGIFDQNGQPIIIGDSVVGFDFRKEWRVSDFPVEQGSFGSYNKVETPFDARVTFTKGGDVGERSAFLASIQALAASLTLISVYTPEVQYPSANVVHYDYRRTSQAGVTLLTVDVWVEEIRVKASAQFTQAQSTDQNGSSSTTTPAIGENARMPSGADPQNQGTVQPQNPTAAQFKAIPVAPGQIDT